MPTHAVHTADAPYAPPVMRQASPANSIGTEYGPDETSESDRELSPTEFARKIEEEIGVRLERPDETEANRKVLLPKPTNSAEEKMLHEQVMKILRTKVAELEEEELFEGLIRRTAQIASEQRPSSGTIDGIMQSLLRSSPVHTNTHLLRQDGDSNRDGEDDIMLDSSIINRT